MPEPTADPHDDPRPASRTRPVDPSVDPVRPRRAVPPDQSVDPVRARRAQVAKWTLLANRIGYLLVALAMALFFIAFLFGFSATMATLIATSLIAGCVLLAPAIILGYAVKAAEREDRERGV